MHSSVIRRARPFVLRYGLLDTEGTWLYAIRSQPGKIRASTYVQVVARGMRQNAKFLFQISLKNMRGFRQLVLTEVIERDRTLDKITYKYAGSSIIVSYDEKVLVELTWFVL